MTEVEDTKKNIVRLQSASNFFLIAFYKVQLHCTVFKSTKM